MWLGGEVRCIGANGAPGPCWAAGPSWTVAYTPNPTGLPPHTYTIQILWVEQATGQPLSYTLNVEI